MSSLTQVIIFSLIGGVFSLVGGFLLISNKKSAKKLATYATPFAAGALLSAAFFDLLVEANEKGDIETALSYALFGIILFFLLERFLHWFHHHDKHAKSHKNDDTVSLIVIGDLLHNFIDGIAIAAGFLVDFNTGVIVTVAVAAHEIPQEIGDFGLLLKKGVSKRNVILINVVSALATTLAAVIFFQFGQTTLDYIDVLLGLIAGFFIYIAASDIIPTIHKNEEDVLAGPQTLLLILGVIIVGTVTTSLHGVIDGDAHNHEGEHSHHETSDTMHMHETYEFSSHESLPSITIDLVEDKKSGWNLIVNTENFTFAPERVNAANIPGEGHAHLYINDKKITRLYSNYFHISDDLLSAGDEIRVTLNTNDHKDYTHDELLIEDTIIVEIYDHSDGTEDVHMHETDDHMMHDN